MSKTGVLLINLGTPDNCDPKSVFIYLTQFLNDPRVIDLATIWRSLLVNLLIVPFRYKKTTHAYQQIWTPAGSPLLINSNALTMALANELGDKYHVELGMRYGNPSIKSAMQKLKVCEKIIVIPLFPQYSSAATGSALENFFRVVKSQWNIPEIYIQKDFFNNPFFIDAYADTIQQNLPANKPDLILFSYHGLPLRHIDKSGCKADCSRVYACPPLNDLNAYCYRAQCYETSRLLAKALNIHSEQYQVTFQSRLGRTPWIKPYTDEVLPELIKKGIKNIAVACPSFVADCLETLEEINLRAKEQWHMLGGNEFTFIPCINNHPLWVHGLAMLVKNKI
jgi:ferrochelatase